MSIIWFHYVVSHEPHHLQPPFIVSQQTWFLAVVWLDHPLQLLLFILYKRRWTSMNVLMLQLASKGESSSGQAREVWLSDGIVVIDATHPWVRKIDASSGLTHIHTHEFPIKTHIFKIVLEISSRYHFSYNFTLNKFPKACIPVKWIFSEFGISMILTWAVLGSDARGIWPKNN